MVNIYLSLIEKDFEEQIAFLSLVILTTLNMNTYPLKSKFINKIKRQEKMGECSQHLQRVISFICKKHRLVIFKKMLQKKNRAFCVS